jgi:asparagine synthase (glutamine-hydrolysing)
MCGICGVVGFDDPDSKKSVVRQMMARMRHRGPDGDGIFVNDWVCLGMRRLSIIDLDGGHQPIFSEDGSVAVVFNGEIYNFRELRHTLESRGHSFRTESDTETIVHAYEEWGQDCVNHLDGMFAFALADTSQSGPSNPRVLLARDRLGIKPLYYALVNGTLLFASEVRSILASARVEPRLSQTALRSYLLFGSVMEPMTLIEGVHSLPPGHRISISARAYHSEVQPESYWNFAASAQSTLNAKIPERSRASGSLRLCLEEAVESHLVADVSLGIFLSSGIDSTVLVALAAQKGATVNTITVAFPQRDFSEADQARRTARRFGTRHQELVLSGENMRVQLGDAVDALDQPSMDGINTYFVSWAAKEVGIKVALSGLGSDELFGGYRTFRATPKAHALGALANTMPATFRSGLASAVEALTGDLSRKDAYRKIAAVWRDPTFFPHPYFYTRLVFTPAQVSRLTNSDDIPSAEPWKDWLIQTARSAKQLDEFTAVSYLESRSYMVNTLLRDTDAMSMAHSLEVRVPFLDHHLVEFVTSLPGSVKRSNGQAKSLLVKAMGNLLPREVVFKPKQTFTLPWENWLRSELREEVETELSEVAPSLRQSLNERSFERVWKDFQRGHTTWSRIWSLFVLNRWAKHHLDNNLSAISEAKQDQHRLRNEYSRN